MPLKHVVTAPGGIANGGKFEGASMPNLSAAKNMKGSDLSEPLLEPGYGDEQPIWHRQVSGDDKTSTRGLVLFWIKKRLPFLQWLPGYSVKKDLVSDIIGGSTIGMVCLAQTLAHAAIATTLPIQGPYCAFVPALVYAFMGTSPHASVSSGAIAAIIIADQLRPWSDINDRTHMASLLALVSGFTLVLIGAFKLSFAVRFLSQPTISGFVTGGSILIITQQLKNLCGFYSSTDCESVLKRLAEAGQEQECNPFPHTDHFVALIQALWSFLPNIEWVSVIVGVVLMVLLDGFNRLKAVGKRAYEKEGKSWGLFVKRLCEMKEIICVLLAVAFCYLTLTAGGNPIMITVGEITPGLPPFRAPWDHPAAIGLWNNQRPTGKAGASEWVHHPGLLQQFCVGGSLVAFTTFLTTFATAKKMALKNGYPLDPAQEMIGLGCAGAAGSFFGAFPPSGSLSRTGLADDCGVKTQMGGVFCAGIIGLGLMYLTHFLQYLPKTTLAAIIITSTKSLVDFSTPRKLLKFWKPQAKGGLRRDFVVWCLAFIFTIFLGVLQGIAIAVVFSVLIIISDSAAPDAVVLGRVDGQLGRKWRNLKDWPQATIYNGIFIFEFRGPLSFASAEWFEERIEKRRYEHEQMTNKKVQFVIISMQSVHRLDSTALTILEELLRNWKKQGVECIVAEARHAVRILIDEELGKRAKLVDQTVFMITIGDAVELAQRRLQVKGKDVNRHEKEKEHLANRKNKGLSISTGGLNGGRKDFDPMSPMSPKQGIP